MGIFKGREGVTPVSNKAVAKQGKESIVLVASIRNNLPYQKHDLRYSICVFRNFPNSFPVIFCLFLSCEF